MSRFTYYSAWATAVLALAAWIFAFWFANSLQSLRTQNFSTAQRGVVLSLKASQATDVHAELEESAQTRAQLQTLITIQPTVLAQAINGAGQAAGVALQIQSASPEGAVVNSPTQAFDFSITGEGSFSELFFVLQLLETLSVPSSIQSFQLIHVSSGTLSGSGTWQLNVDIRMLTSSTIPS